MSSHLIVVHIRDPLTFLFPGGVKKGPLPYISIIKPSSLSKPHSWIIFYFYKRFYLQKKYTIDEEDKGDPSRTPKREALTFCYPPAHISRLPGVKTTTDNRNQDLTVVVLDDV